MITQKPHICFVSPGIFPVFSGIGTIALVGGAEVQQSLLARVFARAGYRVSIVTLDYGQADGVVIDGITVYRAHTPGGGVPGLRFFYPRLTSWWQAMARAGADLYYQRGGGMLTGLVAQFCRSRGKRFVFSAASDADFYPQLPLISRARDRWLYRRGLRMADMLVLQNAAQAQLSGAHYGRTGTIVPSCHVCAADAGRARGGYVLWVATMRHLKRPALVLELARRMPHVAFRIVGGHGDIGLFEAIEAQAAALPNVEFLGYVPFSEMDAQFNGARVFINTSQIEGFPNTFLQAWARGIPVVSFFDNGALFEGRPVLQLALDLDQMATRIAGLMGDDVAWRRAGDHSRACYLAHHTPAAALSAYERCFALHDGSGPDDDNVTLMSRGRA